METRVVADQTLGIPHAGTDELLTPGQAGDYLCTGERFVRRLIAERRIDYVKLGKHVRVHAQSWTALSRPAEFPAYRTSVDPQSHSGHSPTSARVQYVAGQQLQGCAGGRRQSRRFKARCCTRCCTSPPQPGVSTTAPKPRTLRTAHGPSLRIGCDPS